MIFKKATSQKTLASNTVNLGKDAMSFQPDVVIYGATTTGHEFNGFRTVGSPELLIGANSPVIWYEK